MEGNEGSCESNTSAISALLDLTGTLSEFSEKIFEKPKRSLLTDGETKQRDSKDIKSTTEILSCLSLKEAQQSGTVSETRQKITSPDQMKYSPISSPRVISLELDSPRENSEKEDLHYTSDFSSISTTHSKGEMTAWEKWFVMKQNEIRRKTEMERRNAVEKQREMQHQEMLKQKKKEESDASRRQWLERKKMEMQMEQERKELKERERGAQRNHAYTFEHWNLRKYQQKKVELLHRDYMKTKEEEERKKKLKQSEEAVKRWMLKAKQKPLTPRISYAYDRGSAVSFYDSTRAPSPTFVNPIPWQDPCVSPSH